MSGHLGDRLFDFVLGTLEPGERAELERHVAGCANCAALGAAESETFAALALALPPLAPSPALRVRLEATLAAGGRVDPLLDRIGRFFDLTVEKARALLDSIDRATNWEPSGVPGVDLIHLQGGPAVAGADAGFVRLRAGMRFPRHRHLGEERVLVIQGQFTEDNGTVVRRGDERVMATDSCHEYQAADQVDLIYALVLYEGVDVDGFGRMGNPR
ncbi:MAG: hypothetical protein EXR72_04405 [Myxococcales bacterium]|nr:hypothetical protein [Myxococcales bacterium]